MFKLLFIYFFSFFFLYYNLMDKYIKYKKKYIDLKNMVGSSLVELKKKYPNPLKMNEMILLIDKYNLTKIKDENIITSYMQVEVIPDYINLTEFRKFKSDIFKLNCKYKSLFNNESYICWLISIINIFLFSDNMIDSQSNLVLFLQNPEFELYKNKKLIENFNFYLTDNFKDNIKKLFYYIYKNLFFLIKQIFYKTFNFQGDSTTLILDIKFQNEFIMCRNISKFLKKSLNNNELDSCEQYDNILNYFNLLTIIILHKKCDFYRININEIELSHIQDSKYLGLFISIKKHIFCIYKCNNIIYFCDANYIAAYDNNIDGFISLKIEIINKMVLSFINDNIDNEEIDYNYLIFKTILLFLLIIKDLEYKYPHIDNTTILALKQDIELKIDEYKECLKNIDNYLQYYKSQLEENDSPTFSLINEKDLINKISKLNNINEDYNHIQDLHKTIDLNDLDNVDNLEIFNNLFLILTKDNYLYNTILDITIIKFE